MPKRDEIDESSMDDLSRKLVEDLRAYVRSLVPHRILGRSWFDMTDKLSYITDVAMREQRLPRKAGSGTLWDRDELTVRFLLEEGKLNLCLRLMTDFTKFVKSAQAPNTIRQVATDLGVNPQAIETRLETFENSMGLLLSCAFKSVESLQTIDMPLLLEHTRDVLTAFKSAKPPAGDFEKKQESLVISYVHSIFKFLEDLPEDRVMELMEANDVIGCLIDVLAVHGQVYSRRVLEVACMTLSLCCDSEAYKTHKDRYIGTEERKRAVIGLRALFLHEVEKDFETRRRYNTLIREIGTLSMQLGC